MGLYGVSVVSAVTAQNTAAVKNVFPLAPEQARVQLEAILDDMAPAAAKTGMLATAGIVREVAVFADSGKLGQMVVDPVLRSTSGHVLAENALAQEMVNSLIPHAALLTPNLAEAACLTGLEVKTLKQAREAAGSLLNMGARAVCVTGGHLEGAPVDVLYDGKVFTELEGRRLGGGRKLHGTGCLFSAAAAGYLAMGKDVHAAASAAKSLVELAISRAVSPGRGMAVPWPAA